MFHLVNWSLDVNDTPYNDQDCLDIQEMIRKFIDEYNPVCVCLQEVPSAMLEFIPACEGYLIMSSKHGENLLVTIYREEGMETRTKLYSGLKPIHFFRYKEMCSIVNVCREQDNCVIRNLIGEKVTDFVVGGEEFVHGAALECKLVSCAVGLKDGFSFHCYLFNKTAY